MTPGAGGGMWCWAEREPFAITLGHPHRAWRRRTNRDPPEARPTPRHLRRSARRAVARVRRAGRPRGGQRRAGRGRDACRAGPQRRRQDDPAADPRDAASSTAEVAVLGCAASARGVGARGRIGYLGHEPLLYRDLTVRENLRFHARLHESSARGRIAELLDGRDGRRGDELVPQPVGRDGAAGRRLPRRPARARAAAARRAARPPRPRGGRAGRAVDRTGPDAHPRRRHPRRRAGLAAAERYWRSPAERRVRGRPAAGDAEAIYRGAPR